MAEHLTLSEINEKYPNQWVLIVEPDLDEHKQLVGGVVLFSSPDRDEMYSEAMRLPTPRRLATYYTGALPKHVAVVL